MDASTRLARFEKLRSLEREHDLYRHRVDGWSAWRVLRYPVTQLVAQWPLNVPALPAGRRIRTFLWSCLGYLWLVVRARRRALLVKTYRSALRVKAGDGYRDIYVDGLIERRADALKLEVVNTASLDREAQQAWRKPDLDACFFSILGRLLGRAFPVVNSGFAGRTSKLLSSELGLRDATEAFIMTRLSSVFWQARLYGLLLDRVRPRSIIVADTGDFGLAIAARRRSIQMIELQHGVFDAQHPDAVPDWAPGSDAELLIPDRLACFGEHWMNCLAGTRQAMGAAVPVGNEMVDRARTRRSQRDMLRREAVSIVVTSQGMDSERLAEWLHQMIGVAPTNLNWRVSIKLHPMYDDHTTAFDRFAPDDRVRLISGTTAPTVFDLLVEADLHLSIASACHFDAIALGVPSMIIPLGGFESVMGSVDPRAITVAAAPEDVWRHDWNARVDEDCASKFAKPGCIDNLERLLA